MIDTGTLQGVGPPQQLGMTGKDSLEFTSFGDQPRQESRERRKRTRASHDLFHQPIDGPDLASIDVDARLRLIRSQLFERFVAEDAERIPQTTADLRRYHRSIRQQSQPGGMDKKLSGQVSAVDRGNIAWQQGLQRLCIVPVEEVTFVSLHSGQRFESVHRSLEQSRS